MNKKMLKKGFAIVPLLIAGAIALVGGLALYRATMSPTVGAFLPSGGGTYRTSASISSTQNTVTLSSFKEPGSNIPYTMSVLGSDIGYGTLAPQTAYSEFVSFSGITQNADGTATLTGVARGLGRSTPFTASSTLAFAHSGQTVFILSNSPQLYNEYVTKRGAETISAVKTFSVSPIVPTPTTDYQAATKKYADDLAIAGSPDATLTVKGIIQLATQGQAASSTALGSTGASLVVPTSMATDTPNTLTRASRVLMSDMTGYIKQGWLNLTEAFTWTGLHTFSGGLTSTATTTLAGSNYLSNALVLNGVPYQFPSSGIASSTTWAFDANGKATYQYINKTQGVFSTTTPPIGLQTIAHGLGHTPSWVKMTAKYASGGATSFQAAESIGIWDRGVYSTIYHYSSVITNGGGSDNSITTGILYLFTDSDNDKSTATITVDATNIYLTWATDGAPINTASVLWEAE